MDVVSNIVVRETTDYAQFSKLLGNREVTKARLSAIRESILRIGYQPSPILVNEKLEVIDGQGRLYACESLNLPVYYIIKEGLTIDDCISMNIKMKNWDEMDYINCYADRGFVQYVALKKMIAEFPTITWKHLCEIAGFPSGSYTSEQLKVGKLRFQMFTFDQYERARWITAIMPLVKASGLYTNRAIETLIRLDRYGLIDKKRMLESFEQYGHLQIFSSYRTNETVTALNDIYNYNRRQKKYFSDAYKKHTDNIKAQKKKRAS